MASAEVAVTSSTWTLGAFADGAELTLMLQSDKAFWYGISDSATDPVASHKVTDSKERPMTLKADQRVYLQGDVDGQIVTVTT